MKPFWSSNTPLSEGRREGCFLLLCTKPSRCKLGPHFLFLLKYPFCKINEFLLFFFFFLSLWCGRRLGQQRGECYGYVNLWISNILPFRHFAPQMFPLINSWDTRPGRGNVYYQFSLSIKVQLLENLVDANLAGTKSLSLWEKWG